MSYQSDNVTFNSFDTQLASFICEFFKVLLNIILTLPCTVPPDDTGLYKVDTWPIVKKQLNTNLRPDTRYVSQSYYYKHVGKL